LRLFDRKGFSLAFERNRPDARRLRRVRDAERERSDDFIGAETRADLDWHALGEEAATLLSDLIRVDTTNPPGGETAAANLLARKFRAEGIETEVMESAPGRGNLYARLPGQGGARPLILLSHLDVVPADPRDWRIAPFGGIRERGHIYGRGALDAKGLSVIQAMAVIVSGCPRWRVRSALPHLGGKR